MEDIQLDQAGELTKQTSILLESFLLSVIHVTSHAGPRDQGDEYAAILVLAGQWDVVLACPSFSDFAAETRCSKCLVGEL